MANLAHPSGNISHKRRVNSSSCSFQGLNARISRILEKWTLAFDDDHLIIRVTIQKTRIERIELYATKINKEQIYMMKQWYYFYLEINFYEFAWIFSSRSICDTNKKFLWIEQIITLIITRYVIYQQLISEFLVLQLLKRYDFYSNEYWSAFIQMNSYS